MGDVNISDLRQGRMGHTPSSLSCKTSYSGQTMHSTCLPSCRASPPAAAPTRLFYAVPEVKRCLTYEGTTLQLTSTILVSSNSCCTLIMVSACLGSWYFWMKVLMSGNEIAAGLSNDDWGILAVNSSSSLVNSENAGRTGYSWSVMMTPVKIVVQP